MFKSAAYGALCLALLFLSVSVSNANTLTGYAISPADPSSKQRMPNALVEFTDATTGKPVQVKIKTGVKVDDRKDALYTLSTGDPGRWEADVKPGRYLVTISRGELKYTLNLNAFPPACVPPSLTGTLDVTACYTPNPDEDYTQAIKDGLAVLYSMGAMAGGGKLLFPKGFFKVGSTPAARLLMPIDIPSGITIEGVNGGVSGVDYGDSRISLISTAAYPATNVTIFKIGGGRRQITIRDISILSYDIPSNGTATVPGTRAILAEGDYPDTTMGILFSNMSISGFDVGIDVKPCTSKHVYMGNCKVDPNDLPGSAWQVPWQFDGVKADKVTFANKISVRMDTENTDWLFSSCWFHMPVDTTPAGSIPTTHAIHIMRGGFIQINNSFAGSPGGGPGGNFIMIALVATLQIINSQCENVKNSIVYGRDRVLPAEEGWDLGWTVAKIVITGSEFGAPIKLRYRVNLVSTGNHYGFDTIQTDTPLARVYSIGDKYCGDGMIPGNAPCPNPGVQGPGTVVFATGSPAETGSGTGNIAEIPTKFGLKTVFSKEVEVAGTGDNAQPMFKVETTSFANPLIRAGQFNFWYDFKRNYDNGFLEIKGNQGAPHNGTILTGVLQLDHTIDHAKLVQYGGLSWNGTPVVQNGALAYCNNCGAHPTTGDCISGGPGAFAKRIGGFWKCN